MHGIVARMKQHQKCMGRTALGCTAWAALHRLHCMGCTACSCTACTWAALQGVALYGSALHGVALGGAALHGTALHGAALHETALHIRLQCMGLHCMGYVHCMGLYTAWNCIAWVALYKLYVFFCLGGGGGNPIESWTRLFN